MRTLAVLSLALGLLLTLAACQGNPIMPTSTAIPLDTMVTPSPRPVQSPTAPPATNTHPPPSTTPGPEVSGLQSQLDDRLAEATVLGFLDRLAAGNASSAAQLYLTDKAKTGEAGQWLSDLVLAGTPLTDATLVAFLRIPETGYEAQAKLRWVNGEEGGPATQTVTLVLAYQRGLWLIDDIILGQAQTATPVATRKPVTPSEPQAPSLSGKLVFQTSSGGDIYTLNADGSELHHVTDGLDPAWSPDGRQIAFTRWRHPWGVYLINADGTGEERIVDNIRLKEVAWSPDGSTLAFAANYGSSEATEICFFGFCFTIPPRFSGQLWTANLQTGELLSLPLDDRAVQAPTWSPAGDRIVYAGSQGLAWIDLENMEQGRFTGGSGWDSSPTYSPDGQQIAFMSRVHNRWEIFVANADGSGRRQLTEGDSQLVTPASSVAPAWSPDGRSIAFLSNREGPWRIYVIAVDGSQQRPMFDDKLDDLELRYEFASERVLSWSR